MVPPDKGKGLLKSIISNFKVVAFSLQGVAHRAGTGRTLIGKAEEPVGRNTKFSANRNYGINSGTALVKKPIGISVQGNIKQRSELLLGSLALKLLKVLYNFFHKTFTFVLRIHPERCILSASL